jgi:hypothetical protein
MLFDLIKQFAPVVVTLLTTGGFFTFIISVLSRHDKQNALRNKEKKAALKREKTYEIAYRESAAWGRQQAQIIGPAIVAWKDGDKTLAEALLVFACNSLCEDDASGKWHIKQPPNFLEIARLELKLIEDREIEEKEQAANGQS